MLETRDRFLANFGVEAEGHDITIDSGGAHGLKVPLIVDPIGVKVPSFVIFQILPIVTKWLKRLNT